MTSLQRRAGISGTPPTPITTNKRRSSGAFEANFGGLDLTELESGSLSLPSSASSGKPIVSAAAQLLRQKSIEAERAHCEAKEEALMEANVIALAERQSRRLADLKRRQGIEGRFKGRSSVVAADKTVGEAIKAADGTDFLQAGLFSTLVQMHGNDAHGAKRDSSGVSSNASLRLRAAAEKKQKKCPSGISGGKGRISSLAKMQKGPSRGGRPKNNNRQKALVKKKGWKTKY